MDWLRGEQVFTYVTGHKQGIIDLFQPAILEIEPIEREFIHGLIFEDIKESMRSFWIIIRTTVT